MPNRGIRDKGGGQTFQAFDLLSRNAKHRTNILSRKQREMASLISGSAILYLNLVLQKRCYENVVLTNI